MPKTNGAAGKAPKHFETVPLAVVKEIAVEDVPTDQKVGLATDNVDRRARKNLRAPAPTRAPAAKKR